jgi:putative ABC transport system permease protein
MKKSILVTIADQKVDLSDDVKAEIKKIEDSANDAEQKVTDAEQKLADAEQKLADAEQKLADAEQKVEEIQSSWDSCKAGKEQEIAALTAKLDDATSNIKSQEQIDAIVEERVQLVADCKEIFADVDTKLSNSEMKKAVVKSKCDDIADSIDEKSAEYIKARFDILKNQIAKVSSSSEFTVGDNTDFAKYLSIASNMLEYLQDTNFRLN